MRILIAADTYYPQVNGGVYFAQRLAEGLAARGHKVEIIAPAAEARHTTVKRNGTIIHGLRSYPLPKFATETTRVSLRLGSKKRIRQIFDVLEPDVVHCQHHFMIGKAVLQVVKERGCPVLLTNHSMPENLLAVLPFPGFVNRIIGAVLWRDITSFANKVDYVTTPTEAAARLIRPSVAPPVVAVSNGIDLSHFSPGPGNEDVRARYNLPAGPFFLFVGRLDFEKNIDEIVRAFAKLYWDTGWSLVIAGIGTQRKALGKLAERLGVADRVYFPGFVADKDLPDVYRLASCFVIACTCELQSLASLEAISTGLPIIGVNAVALPELIREGVNGFRFETGDAETLVERMRAISSDEALRDRFRRESLAIAATHDLDKTLDTYERIYAQLSTRARRSRGVSATSSPTPREISSTP